jgi:hypothetical protein
MQKRRKQQLKKLQSAQNGVSESAGGATLNGGRSCFVARLWQTRSPGLIPPALDHHVQCLAILIYGSPKVMQTSVDFEEHFV